MTISIQGWRVDREIEGGTTDVRRYDVTHGDGRTGTMRLAESGTAAASALAAETVAGAIDRGQDTFGNVFVVTTRIVEVAIAAAPAPEAGGARRVDGDVRAARRLAIYFDGGVALLVATFMLAKKTHPDNIGTPFWKLGLITAIATATCVLAAMGNKIALLVAGLFWALLALVLGVMAISSGQPKMLIPVMLLVVAAEVHMSLRTRLRRS